MLDNLPPELRINILSRLPVGSLLRLRCVAKSYCTEIDDPNFIKTHLERSLETDSNLGMILAYSFPDSLYSISLDSPNSVIELDYPLKLESFLDVGEKNIRIIGSCNGLLCLSNSIGRLALINPSTRKFQILPFLPLEPNTEINSEFNSWSLGFGYDPIGDDYKIVRLGQFLGLNCAKFANETMIYNLKSNKWRKMIPGMPHILGTGNKMGVLLGDALHWLVDRKRILRTPRLIIAFNLGTDKIVEVPEPQLSGDEEPGYVGVGIVGKWLSVCAVYAGGARFDIWVMKEYGVKESWTKLVSSFAVPNVNPPFILYFNRTIFSNNGDEFLMGIQRKDFMWYDPKEKTTKLRKIPGHLGTPVSADFFHGSLVPLNGNNTKKANSKKGSSEGKKKDTMKRDGFLSKGFKLKL